MTQAASIALLLLLTLLLRAKSYLYGLNASTIKDRSVIYNSIFSPLKPHLAMSDIYNFTLVPGYYSKSFPKDLPRLAEAFKEKRMIYMCEHWSDRLSVTVEGSVHRTRFDGEHLLSILKGKTLAYIGDSLTRQSYLDLSSELSPYQTTYTYKKNGKEVVENITSTEHIDLMIHEAYSQRYYAKYNATIVWCSDGELQNIGKHTAQKCHKEVLMANVIVIGVGAWYKPFFGQHFSKNYYEEMELKYIYLKNLMDRQRQLISNSNPKAIVIWKLIAHVGMIDEITYSDPKAPDLHGDGKLWSNLTLGALWPPFYNEAIRQIARKYHDHYLDLYRLSYLYIKHFENQSLPVHVDSLHYCPGTINRGEQCLLYAALKAKHKLHMI